VRIAYNCNESPIWLILLLVSRGLMAVVLCADELEGVRLCIIGVHSDAGQCEMVCIPAQSLRL